MLLGLSSGKSESLRQWVMAWNEKKHISSPANPLPAPEWQGSRGCLLSLC